MNLKTFWFGIVMAIACEIGTEIPPVGLKFVYCLPADGTLATGAFAVTDFRLPAALACYRRIKR